MIFLKGMLKENKNLVIAVAASVEKNLLLSIFFRVENVVAAPQLMNQKINKNKIRKNWREKWIECKPFGAKFHGTHLGRGERDLMDWMLSLFSASSSSSFPSYLLKQNSIHIPWENVLLLYNIIYIIIEWKLRRRIGARGFRRILPDFSERMCYLIFFLMIVCYLI